DALYIPGGRSPEYVRLNKQLIALVQAFDQAKKPIAAICHGAQILAAAGVTRGRKCSAYPACGPEVNATGGAWGDVGYEGGYVDGHLIPAAAWPAHPAILAKFFEALGTRISH